MGWAAAFIAAHGYLAIAGILLFSGLGMPAPVGLALMLGGAAAHGGSMHLLYLLPLAILVENLSSCILFLGGRMTGWWLLARLCRVTMDPEKCIFRSADFFYQRGPRVLLISRFLPGLNSMAPPLAGSLNMQPLRFWRLDILGATLHSGAWIFVGYLFSPYIRAVTGALGVLSHVILGVGAVALAAYLGLWIVVQISDRRYRNVTRVSAEEVVARLENPDPAHPIVIADVRSHGYYDPGMQRIKNSIRVEPNRLGVELDALRDTLAPECDIYVYCTCLRDATSIRIAYAMGERGTNVKVIEGGMRGWLRSGCPTELVPEGEMHHLPRFE